MANHIDKKDKADSVTKILGDMLEETKQKLFNVSFSRLLLYQGKTPEVWYTKQTINLRTFKLEVNKLASLENKKLLNAVKQGSKEVELTSKQIKEHQKLINRGINDLQQVVVASHINNVASIYATAKVIKSNVADPLFDAISKQIDRTQRTGVTYKDGKTYRWETYLEMKLRTDIQSEITDNLVKAGKDAGLIFYVASFFGDCAPDHADYQGKIYVVDGWETIAPKKRHDEIDAYIKAHKIMTVEEVTTTEPYLTTRPNCRHFFQPLSIDEVLGITNDDELNKKRASLNMNANGKYKPEKYEALSKQRYNERQIRHWKGKLQTQEMLLNKLPANASNQEKLFLQSNISLSKYKIRTWQKEQRTLLDANSHLERNYDREAYSRMNSDFGIKNLATNKTEKNIYDQRTIEKTEKEIGKIQDIHNSFKKFIEENPEWKNENRSTISKQNKHIKGTSEYIEGKSPITCDVGKMRNYVLENINNGLFYTNGQGFKVVLEFDFIIGYNKGVKTNRGTVHISKKGFHVVPAERSKKNEKNKS